MKKSQAYAGTLPSEPMVVPRNTVCMIYYPQGAVTVFANSRAGMAQWEIGLTDFGSATTIPIDGQLWGSVYAQGAGSVSYVFLPRDLITGFKLDSVGPGIPVAPASVIFAVKSDSVTIGAGAEGPLTAGSSIAYSFLAISPVLGEIVGSVISVGAKGAEAFAPWVENGYLFVVPIGPSTVIDVSKVYVKNGGSGGISVTSMWE